jgi:hypothetical protein
MFIEKLPNLGCIPDYIARIWIWIRYVSDTRIRKENVYRKTAKFGLHTRLYCPDMDMDTIRIRHADMPFG